MRVLSNRSWLGCFVAVAGATLAIGACNGTPVGVVDDDGGASDGSTEAAAEGGAEGGVGDAPSETGVDATVDGGSDGSSGHDASSDGTVPMSDASADASDGGTTETGAGDASEAGSDAGVDAPTESGTTQEASTDAAPEAATDASADAPLEAAACTFAGTWSMTVQTVTAVPSFCQGVMDCTNCGFTFNATASQPTPTTIDWSVDPGGTLCTAFSGSITPAGQFTTTETNCSPAGDGSTFDGQIDLAVCSMTATYVYMLSNCTITETMTGVQ